MVTKEQLLIDKLQIILDRALAINVYKPFYIAVYEYIDNFDVNPMLEPVWKSLVKDGEKETAKAFELEKKAVEEMREVHKQLADYVKENKIEDATVLRELDDLQGIEDDRYHSSNGPTKSRYGALSYALMTLAEDTEHNYLPFVRKFGTVTDERRIEGWNFSPSYHKWEEEEVRLDRMKMTKTWYSWDQLFFFYQLFRDYEKIRNDLLEQRKFLNLAGLHDIFEEMNSEKDYREDNKRYLRQFDVGTYKVHLQRLHSYTKEFLLTGITYTDDSSPHWEFTNSTLKFGDKTVPFRQGFRRELISLLCKTKSSSKKTWEWDEVFEQIEGIVPDKSKKGSFYEACKGLNSHISLRTGINDFLVYDTNTVKINPTYIS